MYSLLTFPTPCSISPKSLWVPAEAHHSKHFKESTQVAVRFWGKECNIWSWSFSKKVFLMLAAAFLRQQIFPTDGRTASQARAQWLSYTGM